MYLWPETQLDTCQVKIIIEKLIVIQCISVHRTAHYWLQLRNTYNLYVMNARFVHQFDSSVVVVIGKAHILEVYICQDL